MKLETVLVMQFGELLVNRNRISEGQLEDALQHQRFFPGRLGTQLVELGFLGLAGLEEILSDRYGFPTARDADLENFDSFCLHHFPPEALEHFQILPFRMEKQFLMVAMVNPRDEKAKAWLNQVTDCFLVIHSISEIKFQYFLYRHFRRGKEDRIRRLYFNFYKEKCRKRMSAERAGEVFEADAPAFEYRREVLRDLGIQSLLQGEELTEKTEESDLPPPETPHFEFDRNFGDLAEE